MRTKMPKGKVITFNTLYDNTVKMPKLYSNLNKHPQFRLSSSPFCPYKFIFDWYIYKQEGNGWDYCADFFTGMGTAVHSAIQKWLPLVNPGYILGNWKCRHCCKHPKEEKCIRCTKNCKLYHEAKIGPKICTNCSRPMEYIEFHFIIPPLISGHCDGITLFGKRINDIIVDMEINQNNTHKIDKYLKTTKNPIDAYVLEYKTTTRNNTSKLESPKIEHRAQATMYAPAAQTLMNYYGLNILIKGSLVKYIARDLPGVTSKDLILPYDDKAKLYYNNNVRTTKIMLKAIKEDSYKIIIKKSGLPCLGRHKEYYANCKYMEECSSLRQEFPKLFKYVKKDIKKTFIDFRKTFKKQIKIIKDLKEEN